MTEAALAPILAASADRPFVVAQLGQSLDGRIATISGESRWINREQALVHLHRLRASVDAVVVGVGTVAADDPLLNVRRVPGRNPARVVLDPNGRMPATAKLLAADGARRIVVRRQGAQPGHTLPAGVEVLPLPAREGRMAPAEIVAALFEAGLRRLLIEGGAGTISAFIDAGAIHRLHVLVAPVIIGSGKSGLELAPRPNLADALRPPATVHVFADGDVLFDCDLAACRRS